MMSKFKDFDGSSRLWISQKMSHPNSTDRKEKKKSRIKSGSNLAYDFFSGSC